VVHRLAVYDGQVRVATLIDVERVGCFAFGRDDQPLGTFADRKAALRGLP
jgi:hypothetical protein